MPKPSSEKFHHILALDVETRGLYGPIFRGGIYDGNIYQTFDSTEDLLRLLYTYREVNTEYHIFVFNLEFDLSKIIQDAIDRKLDFQIDFNHSLIINGNFHVCKVLHTSIFFHDIYPLVKSSLAVASHSFELTVQKRDLGKSELEKSEYFIKVDKEDPELNAYLKSDILATYELVHKVIELSKLSVTDFLRCPTIASLAMKIFRTQHAESYQQVKWSYQTEAMETFLRQGYYGGRTEVFIPRMDEPGYHYDINSLYPHVMEVNNFPVGKWWFAKGDTQEAKRDTLQRLNFDDKKVYSYLIHAKVYVPMQMYPPLPIRQGGKLMFPVGELTGYWYRPEFEFAMQHCGIQVLEIYDLAFCLTGVPLFASFVAAQKFHKINAVGAKRNFAKLIQNSLYGKFGMKRLRMVHKNFDQQKADKIMSKGELVGKFTSPLGGAQVMTFNQVIFNDYIRPQYAAMVTSYARVELLKALRLAEEELTRKLYYCDTDALVTNFLLPASWVDAQAYGKFKLEREIKEAIFVLPKLYAETTTEGEEVLKNKGIIKSHAQTLSFTDYKRYYDQLVNGIKADLYTYTYGYAGRVKILTGLKRNLNLNQKIPLRKSLRFDIIVHKRNFDHTANTSQPWVLAGGEIVG